MADPAPVEKQFSRKDRLKFAAAGLVASGAMVAYLVAKGSATNGLHETTLSWSLAIFAGTLASIGLGAIADRLPSFKK